MSIKPNRPPSLCVRSHGGVKRKTEMKADALPSTVQQKETVSCFSQEYELYSASTFSRLVSVWNRQGREKLLSHQILFLTRWLPGEKGEEPTDSLGVFIFMSLNLEWETNSYWWIVSNHAPGRRFSHVSVLSHTHTHCLWSSLVFLSLSTAGSTIIHRHPRQSGLNGLLVAMGLGGISLYLENPLKESSDIQLTSQIIENTWSNYSIVCCLTEEMYIFISVTCAQNYF